MRIVPRQSSAGNSTLFVFEFSSTDEIKSLKSKQECLVKRLKTEGKDEAALQVENLFDKIVNRADEKYARDEIVSTSLLFSNEIALLADLLLRY
ncbi:MAG: hypothetical protein UIM53_06035 [Acutalibacteraceae bacterium]|nr:hypothetical protein [Acutalibacteraceae bacterium]